MSRSHDDFSGRSALSRRSLLLGLPTGLAVLGGTAGTAQATSSAAFRTAADYLVEFYPLWFTYYQSFLIEPNRLIGPVRVSPLYQVVVAINVDTIYASCFVDLSAQPAVLTVPSTSLTYSVLSLDPYGTVLDTPISGPGRFALVGPGYSGTLPSGVKRTPVAYDHTVLIFRIDKFSAFGVDQTPEARAFRRALKMQSLSGYLQDPAGGGTRIAPEAEFSAPYKTAADALIARRPIAFLGQLQAAVKSPKTPTLSKRQSELAARFDRIFAARASSGDGPALAAGARAGHRLIIDSYLENRGPTNWIHYTNIGAWGRDVLARAAITQYIQYGNDIGAAAYYHTFRDGSGDALQGSRPNGYALRFDSARLPEAKRFWSLTAYTPESIELIPNPIRKYRIASYSGLQYNADGSLTIRIAREKPAGVPESNWLPVGSRPFNIMLRVYGPEGSVADNTYVPPAIRKR
ncbi:MAG: DUF1214 domain-containing protein [Geminicoccaceae bacterium]